MKRLFLLLLGLGIFGGLGWLGWNIWQTTRYFEENGREATLVVGPRYNAERWAMPPFKKIRAYSAKLEPKHEVLIETDQVLKEGDTVTIRFLTRDLAPGLRDFSVRPVVNSLRLRDAEDGTPVKIEATNLFDQLVDRAMGPPAAGVQVRTRAVAEAAPDHQKPTVPFVLADADDGTWAILRKNSRAGEWLALALAVLAAQSLLVAARDRQKAETLPDSDAKDFVHPSLRRQEADAPEAPSAKLSYVPRPDEEIVLTEIEKRRLADERAAPPPLAPAPAEEAPEPDPALAPLSFRRGVAAEAAARAASEPPAETAAAPAAPRAETPAPEIDETSLPSLASNETAPPMPIRRDDGPELKLRRK